MIDTSARFEISPSVPTHHNPDEDEVEEIEMELEPSGEILSDSRRADRASVSPISRFPAEPAGEALSETQANRLDSQRSSFPIRKVVRPDGYPSLTPLNHRFRRTNTPTLGPREGPTGAELVAEANQAPRCRHIKASGVRCGAPALRDGEFCYFHNHTHNAPRLVYPSLSKLEDAHGIQVALMEVLTGILDGRLDNKTGALLLYGLQTAVANLKHMPEIDPREITTGDPDPEPEPSCHPGDDAAAAAEAEKAAAAEGVRSTWEHLSARHHVPSRPSGDTARDARYAELMAGYYGFDPDKRDGDAGETPAPHARTSPSDCSAVTHPSQKKAWMGDLDGVNLRHRETS